MKTVSTICAAGSLTALSAVGLALAWPNEGEGGDDDEESGSGTRDSAASASAIGHTRKRPPGDMAAVAHYPLSRDGGAFAFSAAQQPRRLVSEGDDGRHLADLTVEHKRRSAASKGGTTGRDSDGSGRRSGTPSTWMRRLSSNISTLSTSRDSSRTPTSRPASGAFSFSNSNSGSVAVSHSGSTTPIITLQPLPPNKLVKRTSSAHSTRGSPFDTGSRLPILRRPATSHQRSATLQETSSSPRPSTRDSAWRHYFTPRVAAADATSRRGSTGIPNPIKRVYPSRRYIGGPTLVSANELGRPAAVEMDVEEEGLAMDVPIVPSTASSPFPSYVPHFEESTAPRRSFSISDLLANGSQPPRRRPSSKGRPWSSRSVRTGRPRVVSEPQTPMGAHHSAVAGHESERPAKRRGMVDAQVPQRSESSSSSIQAARHGTSQEIDLDLAAEFHPLQVGPDAIRITGPPSYTPPPGHPQLPSTTLPLSTARPARLSATNSEITSTSAGSDSDAHSLGDNSTDYQSDNVYDSYPTRTTRSSSGRRGPHIETIFDESPPSFSSGRSTKLRDFLSDGQFPGGEYGDRYRHSTIEEEDSVVSTPVRSLRNKSITSTPSARLGAPHVFTSSPPTMNMMPDPDEMDWDAPEDDGFDGGLGIQQRGVPSPAGGVSPELSLPFRFGPVLRPAYPHSTNATPQRNGTLSIDKANLFDWSEQQPSPSHASNSPPRPKTVHGKKDQENRWSRPAGRRGPSAMHARSHSVPVVPDLDGKRDTVAANKFGTWGVGSKGVTEDWNEDFDFDEPPHLAQASTPLDERRIDSGHEMFVPKSIREQQENVVANIGLLREWGLLIEELKELRVRAVGLEMLTGPYQQAWREVDAMIELADQESEEHTLEPRGTPPSSPGFDYSAFEDHTPQRKSPIRLSEYAPDYSPTTKQPSTPQATAIVTRPRKDSELVAQSVIAALQSRRDTADPTAVQPIGPSKKVPFDTATLRHIVPYVNGLKRRVKDALRETEGLYSSPRRRSSPVPSTHAREEQPGAPAFRSIFNEPQDDITTRRQSRREQAVTDNDGYNSPLFEPGISANGTPKRN